MVIVFMIAMAATTVMVNSVSKIQLKSERDKKTQQALAEAKAAILSYTLTLDLSQFSCGSNCRRPGDLPCPDTNNDGYADTPCAGNALGRLPWRTLGISDLRDGYNERLWYAVSVNFKNTPRSGVLNSDSIGSITVRNSSGLIVNDGTSTTGVVAVVISPGDRITRQDGVVQSHNDDLAAINYLDVSTTLGEDNKDFINNDTNGFILGPVYDADNNLLINDQLATISRDEMMHQMEVRVVTEVRNNLVDYYCDDDGVANYEIATCDDNTTTHFFPSPASFDDNTCLGSVNISACNENLANSTHGRIPANLTLSARDWNSTSRLHGTSNNNWFQQNGWREVIHYAVASTCMTGTANCDTLGGNLTLSNAFVTPIDNKKITLIATGTAIGVQTRASTINKSAEENYLESSNLSPLDDVYVRAESLNNTNNDLAISLP